ncbi:transglycosylase domain-containing protein [Flavobacterium aquatile]|uniref:Glycosyl transferase n=1 Tax=Flavobacterium aquatile LMG 4008 = ATCC 11947 TaxID=1453498 RepID=A0A095SWJ5_9FLAO|nr:biosynthetic peptidoglycan transglycosylase [Flavobacterium aquatile]KGD68952.1 glycosyl transferase [Flavobacterium aquatile LMG 4008 = ATCC 11947]OXA65663.1 glycosyl transferase [Flavobacterium aquatile] [Flavobacterium aquatile LMG 4008 = ATCC 11947]GEC79601.1 glycosyl transferase [Flavobacterium aquatile]
MRTKKQKIFLYLKLLLLVLFLGVVALFAFRNSILENVISKVETKLDHDYQCDFSIEKAEFIGLSNLEFQKITLVPKDADTLVSIENLKTSVNFWQLFVGNIQLGKLEVNEGFIQLVKNKKGKNFDAFLKNNDEKKSDDKPSYARLAYRILSQTLNLVPTDMSVKGFEFRMDDMGNKVVFDFKQLALENKKLASLINVKSDDFSQDWSITGFADPRDRKADLKFFNTKNDTILIPYLDKKFNLKTSFKSIHFNLENLDMSSGELHIEGFASIDDFTVNHAKIAKKDVLIKKARFDYHFLLGERFIAIDSTSRAQINDIKCTPFISYTNDDDKIYALKLEIPKMKAQDFITSLPDGLFSHFKGMEAQGNFSYNLNFEYKKSKPNNIIFDSKLKPEGLKITRYGQADLNKLNSEFVYQAIENGVPQRPIVVGPANPYFTPLAEISPYLQKCVLTSEDPSFFNHRGFINEAFKQSIAKNIRTKKFARGASTISMQLVKNVFLTREKTLSRKLEEILLVYVLENNRISSKERMLEVYFNVIEWGPNVYGIGEAAGYYFQKRPIDLSLNECLFLATIIPKPKGFMSRFDAQHQLKSYAKQQNDFLTRLMLRRNIITPTDTIGLFPVALIGPATNLLKPKVEVMIDSTATDDFDF